MRKRPEPTDRSRIFICSLTIQTYSLRTGGPNRSKSSLTVWRGVKRMRRHDLLKLEALEVAVLLAAIWMNPTITYAQTGFLSIDCGSTRLSYKDALNLTWVGDRDYIVTGENGRYSTPYTSGVGNDMALQGFRYFPEPREKYCYELPTTANISYIVRAMFFYNYFEELPLPIQFIVSLNATKWFSMEYDNSTASSPGGLFNYAEGIFFSPGNVMNLCLQPVTGVPFISSLELRRLDEAQVMYSFGGSQNQLLANLFRYNIGAETSAPTIRYPYDQFDRLWPAPPADVATLLNRTSLLAAPDTTKNPAVNYVPPEVMLDAWAYSSSDTTAWVYFPAVFPIGPMQLTFSQYLFSIVYCENLLGSSESSGLNIALDGFPGPALTVSDSASMQSYSNFIPGSDSINITLVPGQGATSGPTMNAWEIYAQYNINFSTTASPDDEAISILQTSFSLTDWQGDPCTPVPHDWLTCTITPVDQGPTSTCSSSSVGCSHQPGFLRSTYTVTGLTLSNLTSDGFPIFIEGINSNQSPSLTGLTKMSITNSALQDQDFQFLISQFVGSQLTILDLSYNQIETLPPASDWNSKTVLQSLNLSHNSLSGELFNLSDLPFYLALEYLDLSYNDFTYLPTEWGMLEDASSALVELNLSHNFLEGSISSLEGLVGNAPSLKRLDVSHNNLTGSFSDSFYFSSLPVLEFAIFDSNRINGILNLSVWHESVWQSVSSSNASNFSRPLFSFVNNGISEITPSANVLKRTIDILKDEPGFLLNGILLGGNPYCKGAKSYTQRYLCRYTLDEPVLEDHHQSKAILMGSIFGGIIAVLLLSLIFLAIIWRLRKKVEILREFQTALGDADVRPQFYKYNDLKHATREFHKNNELGRGGFGVVYEAVLNGTALAVKELFNSQNEQVIGDFLKEVVLITGIKHINLVQLKGCCIRDTQRFLVYEFVENGNLAQCLWGSQANWVLDWGQRINICRGIAGGLSYLHKQIQPAIVHRDIKPANILLDKNYEPKIADFGLARRFSDDLTQACYTQDVAGTFGYLSPEYATQGQLSEKVDVYSYGIVVLEIISGRKCIDQSLSEERVFLKDWALNMHRRGTLLEILDPQLKDSCDAGEVIRAINIALLCVQIDPQKRPTMSQVLAMFLPSMDVKVEWDDSKTSYPKFTNLFKSERDIEFPTLQSVRKEGYEEPLIEMGTESSSIFNTGIELGDVLGR